MEIRLVILVVSVQFVLSAFIADDLIVKLPDGKVKGTTYKTQANKSYYGFQGIPYARPPTSSLRFEAPQPPQPWDGILDATKDSKGCISVQHLHNLDTESEDCLYINVYTPSIKSAIQLPVMFWIYGGGFTSGNSSKLFYGPDFLIEEDVVIVSFNYRVAPFGFLSTGDTAIRGNAGLKDQVLALKWVRENIAYFGGDPDKVTIFGESAGGASTSFHVISEKSAGLFRAAIVQSGSALNSWAIDQDPKSYAFLLADALSGGMYKNDSQKLKEFLQGKTAEEIINATISLSKQVWPVMEVEGEDAFLTESPYELLENGKFNKVPIIIGFCAGEAHTILVDLFNAKLTARNFDLFPQELIPPDLRQNSSDENAVIEAIKNTYLEDGETFSSNLVALVDYLSDNNLTIGPIKQAELLSNYVQVYLYQFAYYGRPFVPAFIDGAEKAGHGAELPFIFNMSGLSGTTDSSDILTQKRIVKLWSNFAKVLNPTPEESEIIDNVVWPSISPTNLEFLNLNGTVELRPNLKGKSYPEWNRIYETYGRRPFITY